MKSLHLIMISSNINGAMPRTNWLSLFIPPTIARNFDGILCRELNSMESTRSGRKIRLLVVFQWLIPRNNGGAWYCQNLVKFHLIPRFAGWRRH